MTLPVTIDTGVQELAVGVVEAKEATIGPSPEALVDHCRTAVENLPPQGAEGGETRRLAVRRLLRHGGFKASGRNKPAQEYPWRVAAGPDGNMPAILNAVDLLNVVSLQSGLPISLLALDRLRPPLLIRYGHRDESYVFNSKCKRFTSFERPRRWKSPGFRSCPGGSNWNP
ncbi:MAG: hypothetical protein R6U98_33470 [Pirellulaceae bacterium]